MAKYRRPAFTGEMLTFCEHFMRAVCAELDTELAEFNGEADHVHLLIANQPNLTISTLVQRLKGRTAYAIRREYTGRAVPLRCAPAQAHRYRSSRNTSTAKHAPGLRAPMNGMG